MSLLNIAPADIRKKLNPTNEPMGFLGANSAIDASDVVESIEEWEETVLSRLPQRYQALLTRVDGETLTRSATGGETKFTLGLKPVSNVILYREFRCQAWSERTAFDRYENFTVEPATGAISLGESLTLGMNLLAEYDHGALPGCKLLKRIIKDIVAAEWARRLYPDDERFDRYAEWEQQAFGDIARMKKTDDGRLGIRMFDDLDLINETRSPAIVVGPVDLNGGML